jgi:mevalonate kinase
LIKEKNDLGLVNLPQYKEGRGGLFLLNTGRERRTEPLVNLFLEKCKTNSFGALVKESLLPITNLCITSFLEGDLERLKSAFNELSEFQYDHFSPMIPKLFQGPWLEGLNSGVYNLKLCGAGGGGFLLGITEDLSVAKKALDAHEIRPICHFF